MDYADQRLITKHDTILEGPDGLQARVARIEQWQARYLQGERADTCIGCAALDAYKVAQAAREKEDAEMTKGKLSLRGVYLMGLVQLLGILATLILGFFGPGRP